MIRRIMVPVDGTPYAEKAIPFAIMLAEKSGAEIVLVEVVEGFDPDVAASGLQVQTAGQPDEVSAYLSALVDTCCKQTKASIRSRCLQGPVEETLELHARTFDANLVVMTTHAKGLWGRFWSGSVSEKLMQHLRIPLLLIHPQEEQSEEWKTVRPFQQILIALDGSELAESAIQPSVELARLTNAQVTLLQIVVPPPPVAPEFITMQMAQVEEAIEAQSVGAIDYLSKLAASIHKQGVVAQVQVLTGLDAPTGILEQIKQGKYDLVAVGTHGRTGLNRIVMGSVAHEIIRDAEIPVLVTHPHR